ncbi:MAG: hypothetical protein JXA36_03555 [Coriobacteriia bacterium]|nr:hypothetical protein [Coriobacteriia bacterium]
MDDYSAPTPTPGTPPPPAYQPPPPPAPTPQAPPTPGYSPQPDYAPPAAPPKKKTWLFVVIGLVVLGLLGCCAAMGFGGFALFKAGAEPVATIDAINQAALDNDSATFDKYFDADSVSEAAYEAFVEYIKTTPDWDTVVAELGEEEADRVLREEVLPKDDFVDEISREFSIEGLDEGSVPFPEYTLISSSIENDTAEVTIDTIEDGETMHFVLGMVKEKVGDEEIWRIKEIKNISDLFEDEL